MTYPTNMIAVSKVEIMRKRNQFIYNDAMKSATRHVKYLMILAATGLVGCSSMLNTAGESAFSCPGLPQGITCKTPSAVFSSTNGQLPTAESDLPMRGTKAFERSRTQAKVPDNAMIEMGNGSYRQNDVRTPLPVRAEAKVMRIWIAPWVDKNDDLHLPSFLYTEVQPRKWNLGESEFVGNGVVVPHRVIELAPGQQERPALVEPQPVRTSTPSSQLSGSAQLELDRASKAAVGLSSKAGVQIPDELNLGE